MVSSSFLLDRITFIGTILLLGLFPDTCRFQVAADATSYSYFDDASWAITSNHLSSELGNKQQLYDKFMTSCKETVARRGDSLNCDQDEQWRMTMNTKQPASVYNYTKEGYKKIKAPSELYRLLRDYFDMHKDEADIEWKRYNTYHNMWDSPPTIVPLRKDGGANVEKEVLEMARNVLEEWTGQFLTTVSIYGIRIYHDGSILAPHVDRMPLVSSAIINVDQDVDEPWPLEVYGRDGKAVNVTMEPGDMVLYESHSIIHGRPFPLKGNYYANIFIHFEPLPAEIDQKKSQDLPPYLIPGSEWETHWREMNPSGYQNILSSPHEAAEFGDIRVLKRLAKSSPNLLHKYDNNGWQPLHLAVRAGHIEVLQLILDNGGDVNNPTNLAGIYPLSIAYQSLGEDHEMTQFLLSLGAVEAEEEL